MAERRSFQKQSEQPTQCCPIANINNEFFLNFWKFYETLIAKNVMLSYCGTQEHDKLTSQ